MRRYLRTVSALGVLALLPSCARILYPERVGNRGGTVDVVPLVVDILLFIPGIIPGLIAIVVDFGTGAIYVKNGNGELTETGNRLALRTGDDRQRSIVLEDEPGRALAFAPVSHYLQDLRDLQSQTIELEPIANDPVQVALRSPSP